MRVQQNSLFMVKLSNWLKFIKLHNAAEEKVENYKSSILDFQIEK